MKYRYIECLHDLLSVALNFFVVLPIWILLDDAAGLNTPLYFKFIEFGFCFLLYLFRRKTMGFGNYFFLHLGVIAASILIAGPGIEWKILMGLVSAESVVVSFSIRSNYEIQEEKTISPVAVGIFMCLSIFAASYFDAHLPIVVIPKLALLYTALYLLFMYIDRFLWFEYLSSQTINSMPAEETFKRGFKIAAGFTGFFAVVTFLCLDESLILRFSSWLSKVLKRLSQAFFSLFPKPAATSETGEYVETQDLLDEELLASLGQEQTRELSPFVEFVLHLLLYVCLVIIAAGIVYGIICLIIKIVKRFKDAGRKKYTVFSEDYEEIREKIDVRAKNDKVKGILFLSPSDKIRRLYIKIVEKNKHLAEYPSFYTAREFAGLFEQKKSEDAFAFAKLYEKARYSSQNVTKEDYLTARAHASRLV